ncbi:MAG TPA: hypothetical protein VGE21_07485 [Flavobacteriales bacterium]
MSQHHFPIHYGSNWAVALIALASVLGKVLDESPAPQVPLFSEEGCTTTPPAPVTGGGESLPVSDFVVTVGAGPVYLMNGLQNATLNLTRGQTYTFDLSAFGGQHPFVINSNPTNAGGTIHAGPAFGTIISFTPDLVMPSVLYYHCTVHFGTMAGQINLVSPSVLVSPKVYLEGPYTGAAPPMRDDLRVGSHLPLTEPYSAMGYSYVGGGSGSMSASVLTITGNNAIVDWVVVELRNNSTPSAVVASAPALLQRDGDVVGTNGTSPLSLAISSGTYRLAIRHRNHLGAMTLNGVPLSSVTTVVDLTDPATVTFGTDAQKTIGGVRALWMGDTNFNGSLAYTGSGNDRDPILVSVGGIVPTNTVPGYLPADVDLNGVASYTGANNDRDPILVNIGGIVPTNTRLQQLP